MTTIAPDHPCIVRSLFQHDREYPQNDHILIISVRSEQSFVLKLKDVTCNVLQRKDETHILNNNSFWIFFTWI